MKKFNESDFDMFRSIKVESICEYNSKDVDGSGGSCGGSNYMWGDDYLNDENGMMFIRVVELLVESGCMDFNELDGYDVEDIIEDLNKEVV